MTLNSSEKKLLICEALAAYKKHMNIIVKVGSSEEKRMLYGLPISVIVDSNSEIASILVDESKRSAIRGKISNHQS